MRPITLSRPCLQEAALRAPPLRRATRRAVPTSATALDVLLGPSLDAQSPRRAELRDMLLARTATTKRGARTTAAQAAAVDAAVALLEKRVPSASPVLGAAGVWELNYTTERDVHLACSFPGGASSVTQEVDPKLTRVTNRIAWRLGLALAASGPARVGLPKRLSYRFDRLALFAGSRQLLAFGLGERGPGGWSDTVYVDDYMRVVRNSRGDLLVFQRRTA